MKLVVSEAILERTENFSTKGDLVIKANSVKILLFPVFLFYCQM